MKKLELNRMEQISAEGCGSAIGFALLGTIILAGATATVPVMSGWTMAAIVNMSAGVAVACEQATH